MVEENLLDKIVDDEVETNSDNKALIEEASYATKVDQFLETKNDLQRAQIQKLNSELDRYKEDTSLRSNLAKVFTLIISFWLLAVILILVGNNCNHYNLSDNVLITLMVTSTANVIGMMLIILRNLFPSNESNINSKKTIKKPKSNRKATPKK
ncbi:hypothetical protein V3470_14490 [Flavobacterium oreochromis]|uniref:Uncharacterized protein n=1 Tax=Flavobacterium oreochromis TaxID=2906078 RepID=A0ABW8PCT5_9FLAO|nr:hypothetical protein [Flavobacterium oreochromis]OWP74710.1 hypothetical protein BWG23_13235 [Flavobacterium oreochromis]